MEAPLCGEEGSVLITASKMDGVLCLWHIFQGQPGEGAASFGARPATLGLCFLLAKCGVGTGAEARGRRGAISGDLAMCRPGPVQTVRQWPSLAACVCGKVPGFSGPSFVLYEQGNVGVRSKIVNLDRLQRVLEILKTICRMRMCY